MTAVDDLAADLADAFGLRAGVLARVAGFGDAARKALGVGSRETVVARVRESGSFDGARNRYAVLVGRLRQVTADLGAEAEHEAERGAALAEEGRVSARRRGAQIALLVSRGDLPADAARRLLAQEIEDGAVLAEVVRYIALVESEAAPCQ